MNVSQEQARIPPTLGLLVGVVAVSTASIFIRLAQVWVPSLALAAWRLTFATLLLAPFALRSCGEEWRRLSMRDWGFLVVSGTMLALHFYTWISSLAMTSVAASVVLVSTNPLFVALFSYLVLQERLSTRMVVGMAVAIIGSAVIGLGDLGQAGHQLQGDLLALVGAVTVAVYMLIGRRLRAQLSLLGYVVPVYGTAALVLMGMALLLGVGLTGYPAQAWLWLVLVALIPQVVGHSAFNWALGHLSAMLVSLAVLAEPVGSTLLAWVILGEAPTFAVVVGGVLVLFGIAIATLRPRTHTS